MSFNKIDINEEKNEIINLIKLIQSKKYKIAENNCKKLLKKFPNSFNIYNYLGLSLANQNQSMSAINSYQNALKIKPNFAQAHNNLGITLKNTGKVNEAIDCYLNAIKYKPDFAEAYNNLGLIMMDQGKNEEAKLHFHKAIKIKPNLTYVHRHLSVITKYTKTNPHIKEMKKNILNSNILDNEKMHLAFGLGKAFDDIGEYKNAFKYFEIGNNLRRRNITYDIKNDINFFNSLKKKFNKNLFKKFEKSGNLERTPIFIVGMHRSGTTLTEQILCSHPEVFGGGESRLLAQIVYKFLNSNLKNNFFDSLNDLDFKKIEEMGNIYINVAKNFQPNYKYITDKQPTNFLWLGIIRLILPNAKIIHCIRNPADNCMSIYKNYFNFDDNPYAYNLNELGQYYNLYKDLMKFWHSILPNYIYDISYESLIKNQKIETQKLLKFCNLKWNDNCMMFYKNKRYITTASLVQVRKPIYNNSIKSWKKYEKYIKDLIKILK